MSMCAIGTIRRKRPLTCTWFYKGDPMLKLIHNLFVLRQAWKMIKRRR
jgi:hypothetical protein